MEKTNIKYQFEYQNQRIEIIEDNLQFKTILYVKSGNLWIRNIILPLIHLEKYGEVFADKVSNVTTIGKEFSCLLERQLDKNLYLIQKIFFNSNTKPNFLFKTEIIIKNSFKINKYGPEVLFKIESLNTFDNNFILFSQPTKHTPPTDEWRSNDFPSSYIFNIENKIETIFYVDLSKIEWMTIKTIPRFSHYECGLIKGNQFGLYQKIPLKKPLIFKKKQKISFIYYIFQKPQFKVHSKWEALESWINTCLSLIPSHVRFPKENLSWKKFSSGCIEDLMKENFCWTKGKYPFYHAYVNDESEIQRRKSFKFSENSIYETMTALDIIPPWLLYLQLNKDEKQANHVSETIEGMRLFFDNETNVFYNNISYINEKSSIIYPSEQSIGDSWYFFEPIARLGWFVKLLLLNKEVLNKSDALLNNEKWLKLFKENSDRATKFVHLHNYLISAFYDPLSLKSLNAAMEENPKRKQRLIEIRGKEDIEWKLIAKNYSCLGIYIYIMIQNYYLFKELKYLNNAKESAAVLFKISPDELFWEPIEISYGVAGLTELFKLTDISKYLDFANKLVLNVLRMFYWYNDSSSNLGGKRNILGLVQACVGIRYPAMKENVETIYPWLILLKIGRFSIDILKFLNLIRINSYYYFSNVIDSDIIYPPRVESKCQFIPFEDLELLETPPHFSSSQDISLKGKRTGTIGREVYGAGEVIWLYLMFESLAYSKNEDIMIVNLDLFDFGDLTHFPPLNQNFIIFNPFADKLSIQIVFTFLKRDQYSVKLTNLINTKILIDKVYKKIELINDFTIELEGNDSLYLTLKS